jgi:hypothetical protein
MESLEEQQDVLFVHDISCDITILLDLSQYFKQYFEVYPVNDIHEIPSSISVDMFRHAINYMNVYDKRDTIVNSTGERYIHERVRSLENVINLLHTADCLMIDSLIETCISFIVWFCFERELLDVSELNIQNESLRRIINTRIATIVEYTKFETTIEQNETVTPSRTMEVIFIMHLFLGWDQAPDQTWPSRTETWETVKKHAILLGYSLIGTEQVDKRIASALDVYEPEIINTTVSRNMIQIESLLTELCINHENTVRKFILREFPLHIIQYVHQMYINSGI